jgi:hypothetical protein
VTVATVLSVLAFLLPVEPRCVSLRVFDHPTVTEMTVCVRPFVKASGNRQVPE